MYRRQFTYQLPDELIAQAPPLKRGDSRLLAVPLPAGDLADLDFAELPSLLKAGDLLVFNDTRVLPARLAGTKVTGGRLEIMLERIVDDRHLLAQVRPASGLKTGALVQLGAGASLELKERRGFLFLFAVATGPDLPQLLEIYGSVPLPSYIKRSAEAEDQRRYQTVYAREPGAVAAPTAGLHFTGELLQRLQRRGIEQAFITLHIGAGTFQPLRGERVEEHRMHSEYMRVPARTCARIAAIRAQGGRVVAVGTTVVRALETVAAATEDGTLAPWQGETDMFIYPGHEFKVVDALISNFHLPESSLLVLTAAFAGRDRLLAAYEHAVHRRYRFFSYGDAMFLYKRPG